MTTRGFQRKLTILTEMFHSSFSNDTQSWLNLPALRGLNTIQQHQFLCLLPVTSNYNLGSFTLFEYALVHIIDIWQGWLPSCKDSLVVLMLTPQSAWTTDPTLLGVLGEDVIMEYSGADDYKKAEGIVFCVLTHIFPPLPSWWINQSW